MTKLISIIILNLNGKKFTKNCLNSIKKNTSYRNYNVIVIDNNSTDGSQSLIKSKYKWVDLVENKNNRGFSGGNNDGIKYAIKKYNPDYFYLLNNDTLVEKNWLSEVIKTVERFPNAGIVGSKQLTLNRKPSISAGWIKFFGVKYYWGDNEEEVNWVSGAGFLIKKCVIKKIGLLDEMYNPVYYEESDWEKRAIKNGFKIIHSPKSLFLHKGGGDSSNEKGVNFNLAFYINRSRFFSKYFIFGFLARFITDFYRVGGKMPIGDLIKAYYTGFKNRNKTKIIFPYN